MLSVGHINRSFGPQSAKPVGVIVSDLSSHPGGENCDLVVEFYQSREEETAKKSSPSEP